MAKFIYKAKKSPRDGIIEGVIEAESQAEALNKLNRSGHFLISIHKERSYDKEIKGFSFSIFRKVSSGKISRFTRQFSALVGSGVTILKSLEILHTKTDDKYLRHVIEDMSKFIKDGGMLSDGLKRHPKVFSKLYVSMVASGEMAGALESVLERLANFLDKDNELRAEFKQAMIYPIFLCSVGIAAVVILMIFVIPKLVAMFEDAGQSLPLPTLVLIKISSFFSHFWWFIILVVPFVYFLLKRKAKTETNKIVIDNLKLKLPILGELLNKIEIARFARILGTLLENGVPILRSVEIVSDVIQNEVIKREVKKAHTLIREGRTLGGSLGEMPHFPLLVNNMIAVGEVYGRLDKALFKVANLYEEESGREIKALTALLEPIMILFMSLIVGFIVIAMLMPIFEFNLTVR